MTELVTLYESPLLEQITSPNISTRMFKQLVETKERRTNSKRLYEVVGYHEWILPVKASIRKKYNSEQRAKNF